MIGPGANSCKDKVEMQIERRLEDEGEDECGDEWMSVNRTFRAAVLAVMAAGVVRL